MPGKTRRADGSPTGSTRGNDASDRREIGGRIKPSRQNAGFTQRELAKRLGMTAGAVAQWETGGVPASERIATRARLLGVSLDWLLGKSEPANRPGTVDKSLESELHLIEEARQLGVDLRVVVAEARQQRWLEQNRDALADANAFLDRYGLWSDGKRQF
jgi:transcriptional regulator with XRE-family HTH domain